MKLPEYSPGNVIVTGSTRSGKSTAEVIAIIGAALTATIAIVVIDPHVRSLAWNAFVQLVARGLSKRVLFDRLSNLSRLLGYRFLRPSNSSNPFVRDAENEQTIRESMDMLLRRRDIQSLAPHPLTEEFTFDAHQLALYQPEEPSAADVQFAFELHKPRFHELVRDCTRERVTTKFQAIAEGRIEPGQYGSAQRLIRSVYASPALPHWRGHSHRGVGYRDVPGRLPSGAAPPSGENTEAETEAHQAAPVARRIASRRKSGACDRCEYTAATMETSEWPIN